MAELRKEGILECMKPGGDTWVDRYYVLLGKSEKNQARLDWYDNKKAFQESGRKDQTKRKTIYIEEMERVSEASSRDYHNKKYVFHIECRDKQKPHVFAAPDDLQKRQWITHLLELIETCGIGARSDNSLSSGNSLEDAHENNDYEMSEQPRNFRIAMQQTAASERMKFTGEYDLIIGLTMIQLKDIKTQDIRCSWPIKGIRRYGKSKSNFTFESGRRCETGDGMWKLQTHQGEDIFNLIQRNTNAMRKRDSEGPKRANSVDSPPDLPSRNYDQGNYADLVNDAKGASAKTAIQETSHDKKREKEKKTGLFSRKEKKEKDKDKKDSKKKSDKIAHPPNSTYANYEESPYENEGSPKAGPPGRAEYSEPIAVRPGTIQPESPYAEPDVVTSHIKMSKLVAEIKKSGHASSNAQVPDGMQEYDHIVLSQQHSSPLSPGATGNTYDRLDGVNLDNVNDGTYSEIPAGQTKKK